MCWAHQRQYSWQVGWRSKASHRTGSHHWRIRMRPGVEDASPSHPKDKEHPHLEN